MIFEEALQLMRERKTVYLNDTDIKDSSLAGKWMICKMGLPSYFGDDGKLIHNTNWLGLVCLDEHGIPNTDKNSWGLPTWMILSDKWEVVDET
jgi:hypothetical protein